ncbi:MFS transporter [Bacillus sp. MUM 13]|uniref:MFS transporter n=1 Tax=Bacillus sp. MUM 13 TaxID=1678001 RepID=UPI0008F5B724|nr:MFS transporter [Bacillus sp. MUM 13]OIK14482.1 MFS transporter [Bacillus sp. MUM 13]
MSSVSLKLQNRQNQSANATVFRILIIMGICHLLNDTLQAVVPAMFPILEHSMSLSYTQLGYIAFALNITASIMQPAVGWYSDLKPLPFALPIGLSSTLAGIILLAISPNYGIILFSVFLIGIGSAIFHPEGSRVAYMAAGTKRGLAQSIYQVGGNTGQALAPLITAIILVPFGQKGALWFAPVALCAVIMLFYIAIWYGRKLKSPVHHAKGKAGSKGVFNKKVAQALTFILLFIFARSWYISCMTNYYSFFLIKHNGFSISEAQLYIFAFLAAGALGTFFGGPLADRFGRKNIILYSLAGCAPFTILLPFLPSWASFVLLLASGFIIMTSFSVTVVYAQELVPGKVGTMAGLTVGLAFGMGAIGSVALGALADSIGIAATIKYVGFLPLLGLISLLLPSDKTLKDWQNPHHE